MDERESKREAVEFNTDGSNLPRVGNVDRSASRSVGNFLSKNFAHGYEKTTVRFQVSEPGRVVL